MRVTYQIILCASTAIVLFSNEPTTASATPLERVKRDDKYTTRYDNFDVAGVLASKRLVRVYINCILGKGSCTPEGKELKKYIPDAIATECSKCSPVQKKQAGIVLSHILLNYRKDFDELAKLYDPDGKARKRYNIDGDLDEGDYQDLDDA